MTIRKKPLSDAEKARMLDGLRREQAARMKGYRERALAMYPHVCARCGRALEGKRLRELTVHHKDHNHDNNPPDGSNWELLCLYCHDNEHARELDAEAARNAGVAGNSKSPASRATAQPFANLKDLLNKSKN